MKFFFAFLEISFYCFSQLISIFTPNWLNACLVQATVAYLDIFGPLGSFFKCALD
jgi:hypothetical protein